MNLIEAVTYVSNYDNSNNHEIEEKNEAGENLFSTPWYRPCLITNIYIIGEK